MIFRNYQGHFVCRFPDGNFSWGRVLRASSFDILGRWEIFELDNIAQTKRTYVHPRRTHIHENYQYLNPENYENVSEAVTGNSEKYLKPHVSKSG